MSVNIVSEMFDGIVIEELCTKLGLQHNCGLVHSKRMFCILALTLFTNLVMSLNFFSLLKNCIHTEHDVSDEVLLICYGQWLWGFFQARVSPRDGSAGAV